MPEMKINRTVAVGTEAFRPGQEDELNQRLTKDEVKRLKTRGVISGDFKGLKKEDEDAEVSRERPNPDATIAAGDRAAQRRAKMRKNTKKEDMPSSEEQTETVGGLPEDFPGKAALEAAGITTVAAAKEREGDLEGIDGVGKKTAEAIRERLK